MGLLYQAILQSQRGYSIFPVSPNEKTPHLIRPDKHWMINWSEVATTDINTILAWWGHSPMANIGVACKQSGLFVVDCDMPKREYQCKGTGFEPLHDQIGPLVDGTDVFKYLCQQHDANWVEACATYTVCTGSMGCHYYYRWPVGVKASQSSILTGLCDVRGNGGPKGGGYVLGYGSITEKGSYVLEQDRPVLDAPDWLVEYCTEKPDEHKPVFAQPRGIGTISGLVETVLIAPDGNRNNALHWAACAAAKDGIPLEEALEELCGAYVAIRGPGGERQATQTIRSAYRSKG